jgi:hypothetical protein
MAYDPSEKNDQIRVHAILMLLAWGYFIPVGLFTNSHLYRRRFRQHSFGVHTHFLFCGIGVVLALAGFGYGVKNFTTLSRDSASNYRKAHGVIGIIATAGMILQPLLMAIMRKPKTDHDSYKEWPLWQKVGHFSHRALTWSVSIGTGTSIWKIWARSTPGPFLESFSLPSSLWQALFSMPFAYPTFLVSSRLLTNDVFWILIIFSSLLLLLICSRHRW